MKNISFFLLIVSLLLASSCGFKVPELKNSANGIVAIPIQAKNSTPYQFSDYYKLFSSVDSNVVITIYPSAGRKFVFSKELPPGKYYFDKFKYILDGQIADSTEHQNTWSISSIIVEVQPGAVSIANKELIINQYSTGPDTWNVASDFQDLTDLELQKCINDLSNLDKSNKWKIANKQTHQKAMTPLASNNNKFSTEKLIEATEQEKSAEDLYWLGRSYLTGSGVTKDSKMAAMYFKKAGEQGHAKAAYTLAGLYRRGEGVTKNYEEAIKCYKQAADLGSDSATFALGSIYQDGFIVKQDYEEAAKWYKKAALGGYKGAQAYLDKLCEVNPWACE